MKTTTLFLSILAGAALMVACDRTFACGSNCNYTPQDPSLAQHQAIGDTSAKAGAVAGAKASGIGYGGTAASSVGDTSAQGFGYGGQGGDSAGGAATLTDASKSKTSAVALGLGSFSMAPLPPGLCAASDPEYERFAIPLLLDISRQKANSICPKVLMRDHFVSICHFADARQMDKVIVSEMYPAFQHDAAADARYVNLTPDECAKAKRPVATATPPIVKPKPVAKMPIKGTGPCKMPGRVRHADGYCYRAPCEVCPKMKGK